MIGVRVSIKGMNVFQKVLTNEQARSERLRALLQNLSGETLDFMRQWIINRKKRTYLMLPPIRKLYFSP